MILLIRIYHPSQFLILQLQFPKIKIQLLLTLLEDSNSHPEIPTSTAQHSPKKKNVRMTREEAKNVLKLRKNHGDRALNTSIIAA